MGHIRKIDFSASESSASHELVDGIDDLSSKVAEILDGYHRTVEELSEITILLGEISKSQGRVEKACSKTQDFSEAALAKLGEGSTMISTSLRQVEVLIELIPELVERITGFGESMGKVKGSAATIGKIAETIDIIALNAQIEAAVAGERGGNFRTVAQEVKDLSNEAKLVARRINETVGSLDAEARTVASQIHSGLGECEEIAHTIKSIEHTIHDVCVALIESDSAQDSIGATFAHMGNKLDQSETIASGISTKLLSASQIVGSAQNRLTEVSADASQLIDLSAEAGLRL